MSMLHRLTSLERKSKKIKDRCQEIITEKRDPDDGQQDLASEILVILDVG